MQAFQSIQAPDFTLLVGAARSVIGCPVDPSAVLADAPRRFSTTSLIVWAFRQVSIDLAGGMDDWERDLKACVGSELDPGFLLLGSQDRHAPVSRVGLCVGRAKVVHAWPESGRVAECTAHEFLEGCPVYRGTCRVLYR